MQSMATNILSAYASMATSLMLFRTIGNDLVPEVVKSYFYSHFSRFFEYFIDRFFGAASNRMTFVVDEYSGFSRNQIYDAADVYLRTKINPDTRRLKVSKGPKQNAITLSMEKDQEVLDWYQGFQLKWRFILITPERSSLEPETRYFELTFDRPNRDAVINHYLPFVLDKAKEIKANQRAIKLFSRHCPFDLDDDDEGGNASSYWGCINLDHPVTFDKLAMEPNLKQEIIEDLDRFVKGKDYYKKVGKAWKRGYLLYGPPGTGKSSLVAAMANYLRFDVYYVELNNLYSNSELKRILLNTNNRSIILIEDIDCSSQTHDRDSSTSDKNEDASNTRLTLSGLLNFMDGLWSSCGDERIVIFTTNHKDKLDPALLRPGRMDMHIHMGYCSPAGFDVLALNYLGTSECDHPELFLEIKGLIQEVEITPAEIAEHLMRKEEAVPALKGVVDLLNQKKDVHGPGNATNQGKKSGSGKSFRGKIFTGFKK